MVKWVREQLQALRSYGGSDISTTTLAGAELRRVTMVAALIPRISKRVATISSVGFAPWAEPQPSAHSRNFPPPAILAARRPGVQSRWKEQNRLAIKHSL